jgi:hypothetical protein
MVRIVYTDITNLLCLIFGIVFVAIGTATAWASAGTVLPNNLFEYGFAGAGYGILLYFCYRLLNMVKEQMDKSNEIIQTNTKAMEELKSAIEGKLVGRK